MKTAWLVTRWFLSNAAPWMLVLATASAYAEEASELSERLRSMNAFVRGEAARQAGRMGSTAAAHVPILTDMVLTPSRCEAAEALGLIGPPAASAVPALLEALELEVLAANSPGCRYTLAEALGRIGPAAAAAARPLHLLLRDRDERTADEAAVALGRIEGRIAPLIEGLGDPMPGRRQRAGEMLSKVGLPAVPMLVRALDDPRTRVREGALLALARVDPTPEIAKTTACRLLEDPSPRLRAAAGSALQSIDDADCFDALFAAIRRADCLRSSTGAIFCLGSDCPTVAHDELFCMVAQDVVEQMAAHPGSVAALDAARRSEDLVVAAFGGKGLAASGPSGIPALGQALADARIEVALTTAYGLRSDRLGEGAVELLPALEALAERAAGSAKREDREGGCRIIAEAIAKVGGGLAAESLARLSAHPERTGCSPSAVVHWLSSLGWDDVAAPLQEAPERQAAEIFERLQNSTSPYETERLLKELAKLGEAAAVAVPYLVTLVSKTSFVDDYSTEGASQAREVACAAAGVLAKTGAPGVAIALSAVDRAAPHARRCLVTALWGMGPGAELAVPRLLELGRGELSHEYRDALAYTGERAIAGLVEALSRPENAALAVAALSRMNPRSMPVAALTNVVASGPDVAAAGGARALGEIAHDAAPATGRLIERFLRAGGSCQVRSDILGALVAIGNHEGLQVIEHGLRDDCNDVRAASIRALGKAGPAARDSADSLADFLTARDRSLAKEALEAIAELGPIAAAVMPTVTIVLEDEAVLPELNAKAAEALGRMGHSAQAAAPALIRALEAREGAFANSAGDALERMGSAACSVAVDLVAMMRRHASDHQRWAYYVLRSNPYAAGCAASELASLLDNGEPALREPIVEALGNAGERAEAAVPALGRLLASSDTPPEPVLTALAKIGRASLAVSTQLAARLRDPDPQIRRATIEVLREIGVDAPLEKGLLALASATDEPVEVRRDAIHVLGVWRVARAVPVLSSLLDDASPVVVCSAVTALGRQGGTARSALGRVEAAISRKKCWEEREGATIAAIRDE
jgi:HEAT repeat protein